MAVSKEVPVPKRKSNRKSIGIAVVIVAVLVVAAYLALSSGPGATYNQSASDNQTVINLKARMQSFIAECVSEKTANSDILAYLEDDVGLCGSEPGQECEFNYYAFNVFDGIYFNNCTDIDDQEAKALCEAFESSDASGCDGLSAELHKNICEAVLSNDVSICGQTGSEECGNIFYLYKGIETGDSNQCNSVEEIDERFDWFNSQKQWCRFVVEKNPSLYIQRLEESCNEHIIGTLNTSFCTVLESGDEVQDCMTRINDVFACADEGDPESCTDNIIDLSLFCPANPREELIEIDLFYSRFKFLEENPNICPG